MGVILKENLNFNRDIAVTLKGGYNNTFSDNSNRETIIIGSLNLSKGKINSQNLAVSYEDAGKKPAVPVLHYADPMYQGAYLGWNSVNSSKGYKIKYGTSSGNYGDKEYPGNAINYTVQNLTNHIEYYFAITAYNYYGESNNSNEIMTVPHLRDPNNENEPPRITSFIPADKSKYSEGDNVSIQVTVEDEVYHYDAVECQFLIDNEVKQSWTTNSAYLWPAQSSDFGEKSIKVQARDEYGAQSEDSNNVFIFHKPKKP